MNVTLTLVIALVATAVGGALLPALAVPLDVLSVDNASRIELLQTLGIPDYVKGSISQASVCFSRDGRQLVAACGKSRVPIWDVQSGSSVAFVYESSTYAVACAFSPDGQWVACGGFDRAITLRNVASGEVVVISDAHSGPVWELDFSPDGAQLVSCSLSADVRLWDVATRSLLWSYSGRNAYLSVSFAPSGSAIACGGRWDGVTTLDAATGQVLARPKGPSNVPVGDVAYSSTGALLAAGADDGACYLWEASSYSLVGLLRGHTDYVNGVAFSPDESLVGTGSHDKKVGVWDVANQTLLAALGGHTAAVLRVAFSPDGTLLASVSWDGTIRLWGVPHT